jgi:diacylglycerol kinase family enzyme
MPVSTDHTEQQRQPLQVALVCNPASGQYCPNRLQELRQSFENELYTVHCYDSRTFRLDHIASPVDLICISGGDGTIRTTIGSNEASGHPVPYCSFPSGTINLMAREAGYRANIAEFVSDVVHRCAGNQYFAGHVGKEVFLCCASIGPDSHAVAKITPWLKKRFGRLAYSVAMLKLLLSWPRNKLDLTIDGVAYSAESAFVLKGRYYAGPWILDDQASLTRDRFRVLLMPRARRRDFVRLALFAIFGPIFADPQWQRLDARIVEISAPAAVPIQADGDIIAMTPARISVDSHALNFL